MPSTRSAGDQEVPTGIGRRVEGCQRLVQPADERADRRDVVDVVRPPLGTDAARHVFENLAAERVAAEWQWRTGKPDVAQMAQQRVDAVGPRTDRSPYGVADADNPSGDVADEWCLTAVDYVVGH
jgi:hypothetical protein